MNSSHVLPSSSNSLLAVSKQTNAMPATPPTKKATMIAHNIVFPPYQITLIIHLSGFLPRVLMNFIKRSFSLSNESPWPLRYRPIPPRREKFLKPVQEVGATEPRGRIRAMKELSWIPQRIPSANAWLELNSLMVPENNMQLPRQPWTDHPPGSAREYRGQGF